MHELKCMKPPQSQVFKKKQRKTSRRPLQVSIALLLPLVPLQLEPAAKLLDVPVIRKCGGINGN